MLLYALLLLCCMTVVSLSASRTDEDITTLVLDNLQLTLSSKLLLDFFHPSGSTLKGYMGWMPSRNNVTHKMCSDAPPESICLEYSHGSELLITPDRDQQCEEDTMTCHAVSCYKVQWKEHKGGAMDCFLIGDDHWYGGTQGLSQRWPIQVNCRPWFPVVTGDPLHHPSSNVVENLWISSGGYSIYVDHHTPLFISFNESGSGHLCLTTSSKKYPYQNVEKNHELAYTLCAAANIKDVYSYSAHRWLARPTAIPEENVFSYPIWSTWARYKRNIDQEKVENFAEEIMTSEFSGSQLEVDDMWESCYGNLDFDSKKFPNPKDMVERVNKTGLATTLWVHPFCNVECSAYQIGERRGFWVKNRKGHTLHIKWWNGIAAVLDTTNELARLWFVDRLKRLQSDYGVASFKFDAGEVMWLEEDFLFHDDLANSHPNLFSRYYIEMASSFGGRTEVRVGYLTQHLPLFVREIDKFSQWDYANGLKTLIPSSLQLSILGYPFIIPDMVGGNNYDSIDELPPDPELYLRWLEASVFLPTIQFSIPPWDYDDQVMKVARMMLQLRDTYNSYLMNHAYKTITTGHPIVRPLWWIAPEDEEALVSDSQFLVGDGIMVAPVLEQGASSRHIYLPEGKWADVQKRKVYAGPQWLYDYEAPLNFLPFFIRQS